MSIPHWAADLADTFWGLAGMQEAYPRNLRRPIARALPMAVISLPGLRLRQVQEWLRDHGVGRAGKEPDRTLRACLVARDGWGYLFLDGTDPEDEQRLSLAHELAHFLRHYWQPRREAVRRLGDRVSEVLDGRRPPTAHERLHGLLAGVRLGFHWHLMRRDDAGDFADAAIAAAEREADLLGYELLAPAGDVLGRAGDADRDVLGRILRDDYGLPVAHAARYSLILLPPPANDPLLRRLGLSG